MFGIFKSKRKREQEELAFFNKLSFINNVQEMRKASGLSSQSLADDDLVYFYAVNLADLVFRIAKEVDNPIDTENKIESAATLVFFTQALHMGARMMAMEDQETKSIIFQNGSAALLGVDLDDPGPEALSIISLSQHLYQLLSKEYKSLLVEVDGFTYAYLMDGSDYTLQKLALCWKQAVAFFHGSLKPS